MRRAGPPFRPPLELEIATPGGPVRHVVEIADPVTRIEDVPPGANDVLLDPDHRLLLTRHRGERVRFSVEAPHADSVALIGDFAPRPIGAERKEGGDGTWSVAVPLTAGTYAVGWLIDGERAGPLVTRTVPPTAPVERAYPRG